MNLVKETCLSHQTIGRRIGDLGDNIEGTLKDKLSACVLYSLALNESTDQSDTAQLVIFILLIDENLMKILIFLILKLMKILILLKKCWTCVK